MQTEDSFVDELWSAAPASGASLLSALFPRCFIDPNRAPDDVDPEVGLRVQAAGSGFSLRAFSQGNQSRSRAGPRHALIAFVRQGSLNSFDGEPFPPFSPNAQTAAAAGGLCRRLPRPAAPQPRPQDPARARTHPEALGAGAPHL